MSLIVPDFDQYPIRQLPQALNPDETVLSIIWDDGQVSRYPLLWLREHSPDSATHNEVTREPNFAIVDLPEDPRIAEADLKPDGTVTITWRPDNLVSHYHPGWLRAHCPQRPQPTYRLPERVLWNANSLLTPPAVDGATIDDDAIFGQWVQGLHTHGVSIIEGLAVNKDMLEQVVERIGPIRTSNFGRIFDVKMVPDSNSNAYTAQPLSAHTDLATREYAPGLQFFFCMENSVEGGVTLLSDGFAIAEKIREAHPEEYAFLTEVPVPFVNRDKETEYRYEVPILETDRQGNLCTVRFTYWLRAPMTGDPETLAQFYRALRLYHHYADQDAFQVRFPMQPGMLLGVDNRRVLHGRTGFSESCGKRWLRGCYMEREEVESRLRVLDRHRRMQRML